MKVYKAGEKSKAVCEGCKATVATTFTYRDVPFDDGTGIVKDILVSVCESCEAVVAIPAQSTPAIKRAREVADIPLEVSLPASDLEILDLAAFRIDPNSTAKFRKSLLTWYLQRLSGDEVAIGRLSQHAAVLKKRHTSFQKIPRRRLSFKVSPRTDHSMQEIMSSSGLTKTQLVRGIVHQIETDLITPAKPRNMGTLRDIAAVVAA